MTSQPMRMCFRWCRNRDNIFKRLKDEHGLFQHISLVDIVIGHPRVRYPGLENCQQGRISRSFLPARICTISEHHHVVGVCLQHMASRSLINAVDCGGVSGGSSSGSSEGDGVVVSPPPSVAPLPEPLPPEAAGERSESENDFIKYSGCQCHG
jgi:hypothetical protein